MIQCWHRTHCRRRIAASCYESQSREAQRRRLTVSSYSLLFQYVVVQCGLVYVMKTSQQSRSQLSTAIITYITSLLNYNTVPRTYRLTAYMHNLLYTVFS